MLGSRISVKLLRSEEGRSLPFVLVVVAVGALLVSPFLAHVSTSLLGSRAMQEGMNKQYASDAGVEFGIWKLVNDSDFRSQVDLTPGTPVPLGPITVNQFTTSITVTALSAGGWITLTGVPVTIGAGGALAYAGGDYIYACRGNNSNLFGRYSISGDSWEGRATTPSWVGDGGALAYAGGDYIYAFRGNNREDFWRYSISGDSWSFLTDAPARVGDGGALVYAGGDYIYAFRGNNRTDFWRYSISGNSWTPLSDAPDRVRDGGALVYTGGDYIYALRGSNSRDFWRYSISNDSWTSLPDAPDTIGDGGALTYDGTYIYALRGNNSQAFWRFSPGPPTYDIMATADGVSIEARVAITGTDEVAIQSWETQ